MQPEQQDTTHYHSEDKVHWSTNNKHNNTNNMYTTRQRTEDMIYHIDNTYTLPQLTQLQ